MCMIWAWTDGITCLPELAEFAEKSRLKYRSFSEPALLWDALHASSPDLIVIDKNADLLQDLLHRIPDQCHVLVLHATLDSLMPHRKHLESGFLDCLAEFDTAESVIVKVNMMLAARQRQSGHYQYKQHFDVFFQYSGLPTLIVDSDTTIVKANQTCATILGYSPYDLEGRPWTDFVHEDDQAFMLEYHYSRRQGKSEYPTRYETRILDADGNIRTVMLTTAMLPESDYSTVSLADITVHKQLEEELAQIAQDWEDTFNASNDAIWIMDEDSRILQCNHKARALFGANGDELEGRHCYEVVHGTNRPIEGCPMVGMLESRRRETMELPINGSWYQVTVDPINRPESRAAAVHMVSDVTEKKQAVEALHLSREQYRSTLNALGDAVHVINRDGVISLYNDVVVRFASEIGYHQPLKGASVFDVFDFLGPEVRREYKQVFKTGQVLLTSEKSVINGRTWYTETRKIPVVEGSEVHEIITVVRDVTERKRAELALRASEEQYRLLAENSADCIWTMDKQMRFTYLSPALEKLVGYRPEEWLGKRISQFIAPNDSFGVGKLMTQAIKDLNRFRPVVVETVFQHKDGSAVDIEAQATVLRDSNGKLKGFQGITRAISERKEAEQRFRSVSKVSTDLIYEWTLQDDRFEWFGPVEYVLGYKDGEIGHTLEGWLALSHPEDQERVKASRLESAQSLDPWRCEYRVIKKDGSIAYWQDKASPVLTADGHPVKWIGGCLDITERKQSEIQTKRDLDEKTVLLKEVHHRVKNNLQIMSSLLNLQAIEIDDERINDILKVSRGRIHSMAMVHEMMYRDMNVGKINMHDYIQSLGASLNGVYNLSDRNVQIRTECGDIMLPLDDAIPCGIIVNELISNAMKHAFVGRKQGSIKAALAVADSQAVLSISDDGVGMKTHPDWEHVDSLGLRLVYLLANDQLEGSVELISEEGKGAEFRIKWAIEES